MSRPVPAGKIRPMLSVRPARQKDDPDIVRILNDADLHFSGEKLADFQVAELDGKLAGIVRLEEHEDFVFLSSLGVAGDQRNKGVATALLKTIFERTGKPIYLYTVIPQFFKKFGFHDTTPRPQLPPKETFGCDQCSPGSCSIMVREP